MKRRVINPTLSTLPFALSLVGAVLFALCSSAESQQAKNVHRIGFLSNTSLDRVSSRIEAFRQGLRELGYVEGQNIIIDYRFSEDKLDRLPDLADQLVRLKVECIVAAGTQPTLAAKRATAAIPIVMGQAGDPVEQGLVKSLAQPEGNITGLTDITRDLAGKRLELLKEAVPNLKHAAVIWTQGPPAQSQWEASQRAAGALSLRIYSMELRKDKDLDRLFAQAVKAGVRAFSVVTGPGLTSNQNRIRDLGEKHRLPSIWTWREFAEEGGMMAYGPSRPEMYHRAASYVDGILKGTKPADLPVEQPTKFEFVINLKTARQIGLTIPPNVLARADRVIR
jgi:putative tryptophan/tyrosine transport system substrate-binding protein